MLESWWSGWMVVEGKMMSAIELPVTTTAGGDTSSSNTVRNTYVVGSWCTVASSGKSSRPHAGRCENTTKNDECGCDFQVAVVNTRVTLVGTGNVVRFAPS